MKATEQYFAVMLLFMLYNWLSSAKRKSLSVTIHLKATEQYFPVVL